MNGRTKFLSLGFGLIGAVVFINLWNVAHKPKSILQQIEEKKQKDKERAIKERRKIVREKVEAARKQAKDTHGNSFFYKLR